MYSAFFIQPKVEKESRIVRCDPFVQKYTVALFILRVQRRKDKMGGVIVGESDNLVECWKHIDLNDGKFSDDFEKVMVAISEIAMANKCTVVFQQSGDEPTFSETKVASFPFEVATKISTVRSLLRAVADDLTRAGFFVHVNNTEYYDVDKKSGSPTWMKMYCYAVGAQSEDKTLLKSPELLEKYGKDHVPTFASDNCIASFPFSEEDVEIQILQNEGTQKRYTLCASFRVYPHQVTELFGDMNVNKATASAMFQRLSTADNIFVPKNMARGVLTKVGTPSSDAIMYDLSLDHIGTKLIPVLDVLFESDGGVRGAVVAYGMEAGVKDKLFLIKGAGLTSEQAAMDRCTELLQEMYKEDGEDAKEFKKPTMRYFKFRI